MELSVTEHKRRQLETILHENPAPNDIYTWIRDIGDILTWEEAIADNIMQNGELISEYPDVSVDCMLDALSTGVITVYSSHSIRNGTFVTPSRMEAHSYAGNGTVYQMTVNIDDVAWIGTDQGQYAKV